MPSTRAILLEDIEQTERTLARLKQELRDHTVYPLEFLDEDGDSYVVMRIDNDNAIKIEASYIEMEEIPSVIEWLNKVIGEEQ